MSGEILADGDSPMIMTVDQYNERVARTWNLAIAAEQERIIEVIKAWNFPIQQGTYTVDDSVAGLISLIKGEK